MKPPLSFLRYARAQEQIDAPAVVPDQSLSDKHLGADCRMPLKEGGACAEWRMLNAALGLLA